MKSKKLDLLELLSDYKRVLFNEVDCTRCPLKKACTVFSDTLMLCDMDMKMFSDVVVEYYMKEGDS